jgi:hypothetical protein
VTGNNGESVTQVQAATRYVRNPEAAIIVHSHRLIHLRANGNPQVWTEGSDVLWRILKVLREPKILEEILSEAAIPEAELMDLLKVLIKEGLVVASSRESPERLPENGLHPCDRLVLGISGAIQATSIISLVLQLRMRFAKDIQIVLTKGALHFLPPSVVRYYGFGVWTDIFETRGEINVPHIHLASTASMVAIIPASANTIHRLATGECSDLLSLTVSATKAPVVVAPAMNSAMLSSPAIERNINRLREDGMYIVEPGLGWEVSEREISSTSVGGIGVKVQNVVPVLYSILLTNQRLAAAAG